MAVTVLPEKADGVRSPDTEQDAENITAAFNTLISVGRISQQLTEDQFREILNNVFYRHPHLCQLLINSIEKILEPQPERPPVEPESDDVIIAALRGLVDDTPPIKVNSENKGELESKVAPRYDETSPQTEGRATGETPGVHYVDVADRIKEIKNELTKLHVRPEKIQAVVDDIVNADRAKWLTPLGEQKPELRGLTAPSFLKRVWADRIVRGKIPRSVVWDFDPDLVKAFGTYVSQRKSRGVDAGDAKGITLTTGKKLSVKQTLRP